MKMRTEKQKSLPALLCFCVLAPLCLASGARAEVLELTLSGAVGIALEHNAAVINAGENRGIYKERVREYWGTVFPQLSASGLYTRNINWTSISEGIPVSITAYIYFSLVLFHLF